MTRFSSFRKHSLFLVLLLGAIGLMEPLLAADLPPFSKSLGTSSVSSQGNTLTVSTGEIERSWLWTGHGLRATALTGPAGVIALAPSERKADWDLGNLGEAKLLSLRAQIDDDQGFTNQHLSIEAEIEYEKLTLKYVIWALPGAPGLRTQLWLKRTNSSDRLEQALVSGISERLELKESGLNATVFGYAAGLKNHVPDKNYNILETRPLESGKDAGKVSGLMIAGKSGGVALIKESNTHTKMGHLMQNGTFHRKGSSFIVDGLGLLPKDLTDEYRFCWANWMIPYAGNEQDGQLAIKRFDRARYPVSMDSDVYIMANTWGTEDGQPHCFYKAREENVLREIAACADLGLDMLQIDEGWQISRSNWQPAKQGPLVPKRGPIQTIKPGQTLKLHDGSTIPKTYDVYPDGFANVRNAAEKAGIKLGLWFAHHAPAEDLKSSYEAGNFKGFKLDFAHLKSKDQLHTTRGKTSL